MRLARAENAPALFDQPDMPVQESPLGEANGFPVRKPFKIAPGVKLNLSKSGVSTSIDGKGLTVNLENRQTKTTIGVPGTGLSYSTSSRASIRNSGLFWLIAMAIIAGMLVAAL